MAKNRIKEPERLRSEVRHVRVPRPVETRGEQETRVVVEQHESRLMNDCDRHLVVASAVSGRVLQCLECLANSLGMSGSHMEEEAELACRPNAETGSRGISAGRCHQSES